MADDIPPAAPPGSLDALLRRGGGGGGGFQRKPKLSAAQEPATEEAGPQSGGAGYNPGAVHQPALRRVVADLIVELDAARAAREAAEGRVDYLAGLAEGDGVLPVLNRPAFLKILSSRLEGAEAHSGADRAQRLPGLAYFYLDNFETLRRDQGLEAALAVLSRAAIGLFELWGLGFPAGTVGGASLLVVLDQPGPPLVPLRSVLAKIADRPLRRRGQLLPIHLSGVAVQARPGETALALIARAEATLLLPPPMR
ncbi:MAG: hypothetical protein ACPGOY_12515 [Rhodospirillaceae bacterium]